jgi:transposase-like protein
MAFEKKYSDELRDAAVRRVVERREAEPGNRSIFREVAEEFEVGEQSLRLWAKRLDDGMFDPSPKRGWRSATKDELFARIAELEEQLAVAREEVEVLKRASAIFAAEIAKR